MKVIEPGDACLEVVAMAHRGLLREQQEDAIGFCGWNSQTAAGVPVTLRSYSSWPTFALADGLGGHAGGAMASLAAVSVIAGDNDGSPVEDLVHSAHERIRQLGIETGQSGTGTTIAAIGLREDGVQIVNVGDSRIYEVTSEPLLLSVDDSPPAAAAADQPTPVVTQALGIGNRVLPHVDLLPLELGVRFLVCSDGLNDAIGQAGMDRCLASSSDARDLVVHLVAEALRAGGDDNVSVAVVTVCESSPEDPELTGEIRTAQE